MAKADVAPHYANCPEKLTVCWAVLIDGSAEEIRQEVHDVLTGTADRHILEADCTLPGDIAWENIRLAVAAAHDFRR